MEPYVFPNYASLCGNCNFKTGRINAGDYCRMQVANHTPKEILEELSIFLWLLQEHKKKFSFQHLENAIMQMEK